MLKQFCFVVLFMLSASAHAQIINLANFSPDMYFKGRELQSYGVSSYGHHEQVGSTDSGGVLEENFGHPNILSIWHSLNIVSYSLEDASAVNSNVISADFGLNGIYGLNLLNYLPNFPWWLLDEQGKGKGKETRPEQGNPHTSIPESSTIALLGVAMLGMVYLRYQSRRRRFKRYTNPIIG
ncbi:hypothetical protein [Thalassotalea mangrovi]|uniref:PEP-CTERM sorting domain-containing protein n=1 Tax=Thalassotalea mangrovi TaxID=2572245 RepID=A0A4U1B6B1_9GAMM|nr:hypothetical protein [Thalassotalea mangrovi]TKB45958.1 hypothetical protein E8M12_06870 [Thalassotalea mangrovi]